MYRLSTIIRKNPNSQKLLLRSLTDAAGNELKLPVSFEDVSRAYHRIRDGVKRTVRCFKQEFSNEHAITSNYIFTAL